MLFVFSEHSNPCIRGRNAPYNDWFLRPASFGTDFPRNRSAAAVGQGRVPSNPAAVMVWLGERIRSLLFYGCAGGAIGALSQALLFRSFSLLSWLFILPGYVGGFDYWFVAGKHAGRERDLPDDTP
jgi:hypothetical protein